MAEGPDFDEYIAVQTVFKWIEDNGDSFVEDTHQRKRGKRMNLWETTWGHWLKDPETKDPTTFAGRRFRQKFRVPYPLFEFILQKCEEVNLFDITHAHLVRVDLEFKVLIAFAYSR